jgi:PRTRC genetic system protein E
MFRELSPLLTKRSLVFTVASVGDERIRVTITPRPTNKDEAKEVIQPFAVEGTAAELDRELPSVLVGYTGEHMTLARSLEQVKANMDAALKEAKDEAAKKVADAKRSSKPTSAKPGPAAPEAKKVAAVPSLFDSPSDAGSSDPPVAEKTLPGPSVEADEEDEDEDEDDAQPPSVGATAAGNALADVNVAQSSMFDTQNDEDEILQEAFYGAEDSHIAA